MVDMQQSTCECTQQVAMMMHVPAPNRLLLRQDLSAVHGPRSHGPRSLAPGR